MTHEELQAALPAYAAGGVDEGTAAALRAHIANGCTDCLRALFATPRPLLPAVLLPALAAPLVRRPAPPPGSPSARGAWVLVACAGLASVLGLGWLLGTHGRAPGEVVTQMGWRLEELESERDDLASRLARLEGRVAAADAARSQDEAAARAAADELAAARSTVADLQRDLRRRDGEIGRLHELATAQTVRGDLLGAPGTSVLPLTPMDPFRDVRGHVLWNPDRAAVVLYAFGLPRGRHYRLRVDPGDAAPSETSAPFAPDATGEATLSLRLSAPPSAVRGVEVLLEPAGRPVLAASHTR